MSFSWTFADFLALATRHIFPKGFSTKKNTWKFSLSTPLSGYLSHLIVIIIRLFMAGTRAAISRLLINNNCDVKHFKMP